MTFRHQALISLQILILLVLLPVVFAVPLVTEMSSGLGLIDRNGVRPDTSLSGRDIPQVLAEFDENSLSATISPKVAFNIATAFADNIYAESELYVGGRSFFLDNISAPNVVYSVQVGTGLALEGTQDVTITNTGVLSIQGEAGDVEFTAGEGIEINGTEIRNTGVTSLQGQTGPVQFTAGEGIVISGTTISVENEIITQALISLAFDNTKLLAGGTQGSVSFVSGDGITLVPDAATNTVVINSQNPAPGFKDTGSVVQLINTTDSLTIGSESAPSRFNVGSTNGFQVSDSGAIVAATGINTSGNIRFSDITNGLLRVDIDGNVGIATAFTDFEVPLIFGNGFSRVVDTITLGNFTADWIQSGQYDIILANDSSELLIQGNGSSFYGRFDVGTLTANRTYTFPDDSGEVCLITGNCAGAGGGVTTTGGSLGRVPRFNTTQEIGDGSIQDEYPSGVRVTIDNAGLVGIGTTTPAYTLDVGGDIRVADGSLMLLGSQAVEPGTAPNGAMYYNTSTGTLRCRVAGTWANCDTSLDDSITGTAFEGQIAFFSSSETLSGSYNLFWDSVTNRLGIGTSTPGATFTVGSSNEFQITSAGTISAATGITSSGIITFSGLSTGPVRSSGGVLGVGDITLGIETAGNFVETLTAGNGIAITGAGVESANPTVALGPLTGDWNQTGALDIILNNADSELRFRSADGATFYGTLDVGTLTSSATYTFPPITAASAEVCLSTGNCLSVGGTVTSPGGTTNRIAKFTGANTIDDSLISDNGTIVTVNGDFAVTGISSFAGNVDGGGTAAISNFTTINGANISGGTLSGGNVSDGTLSGGDYSAGGLVAPGAYAIRIGDGTSLSLFDGTQTIFSVSDDGLTGTLVVNTITTSNISAFTALGDITGTASSDISGFQTINGATISGGSLEGGTLTGGTYADTGATVSGAFDLTIGNGDAFRISDGTNTILNITDAGTTTNISRINTLVFGSTLTGTIDLAVLGQNRVYTLPDSDGVICLDSGNCTSVGGTVTVSTPGTTNRIPRFTGAQTIADGSIQDEYASGARVFIDASGNVSVGDPTPDALFTVGVSSQFQVNGTGDITARNFTTSGDITGTSGSEISGFDTINGAVITGGVLSGGTYTNTGLQVTGSYQVQIPDSNSFTIFDGTQDIFTLTDGGSGGDLSALRNLTASGVITFSGLSSGPLRSNAGLLETGDTALGSETTGNYVATITAGNGISQSGSGFENANVTVSLGNLATDWVQSGAGDLVLSNANSQLVIMGEDGTNLATFNVASLSGPQSYTFPNESGEVCLSTGNCLTATNTVTSPGGTVNRLARFSNTLEISDSAITDTGSLVTIASNVDITGTSVQLSGFTTGVLQLDINGNISSNPVNLGGGPSFITGTLGVANGGTGATTFTPNAVLFGNGTAALQTTVAPTGGQVLLGNASGIPTFTTLSGDILVNSSGVTTVQPNSVTLGTDTTGNYVLGLTDGSGITSTGTPGEGWSPTLNLGNLTADWQQSGAFDIVLNNADSELRIESSNGNDFFGTIDVGILTGDRTYTFPDDSGEICLDSGNCLTSTNSVTSPGGDVGRLARFTAAREIDDSSILDTGGTVTIEASLTVTGSAIDFSGYTAGVLQTDADGDVTAAPLNLASGTTYVTGILPVENGGTGLGTVTGNGVLYGAGTGALQVTAAPTGGQVLLGNSSGVPTFTTLTGDVFVSDSGVTTIQANSVALGTDTTGNYVGNVAAGSGISVSGTPGEAFTPSVALGSLTANWIQSGAWDIRLENADSELQIMSADGASFFGTIDVTTLTTDQVYTFPDASGEVCLTTGNCLDDTNSVTSPGGIVGNLARFTGTREIDDSIISDSGSLITVGGDLTVTGTNITFSGFGVGILQTNTSGVVTAGPVNLAGGASIITGTLPVGNGGTGRSTITPNTVLFGNGSGTVSLTAAPTGGQVLMGNAGGVPTFTSLSGDVTVSDSGVTTIGANAVTLGTDTVGNYVTSITNGNGISSSGTPGEGWSPQLDLAPLTANWVQGGAYDVIFDNQDAELLIRSADGASFYGTFDTTTLTADRTYTFPDASGTVAVSASSPIALSASGDISCPTCVTSV
ncbi:MAG: autotransporter adhesin family protein, partial [Patescibacteria group bacterium]|nr:autotransporter adhesin family protein [Patescibacteria group bacterium]